MLILDDYDIIIVPSGVLVSASNVDVMSSTVVISDVVIKPVVDIIGVLLVSPAVVEGEAVLVLGVLVLLLKRQQMISISLSN